MKGCNDPKTLQDKSEESRACRDADGLGQPQGDIASVPDPVHDRKPTLTHNIRQV
jgi:hypothetical protein